MAVTLNPSAERMEIVISGPLTIMEAAETRDQLALGLTTAGGPVTVDLSAVTELDSAGLQLLLALVQDSRMPTLLRPSDPVQRVIHFLGLRETLRLKEDHHGL